MRSFLSTHSSPNVLHAFEQVDDLFPGLDCPRMRYPRLNDEVEAELAAAGYQVGDCHGTAAFSLLHGQFALVTLKSTLWD